MGAAAISALYIVASVGALTCQPFALAAYVNNYFLPNTGNPIFVLAQANGFLSAVDVVFRFEVGRSVIGRGKGEEAVLGVLWVQGSDRSRAWGRHHFRQKVQGCVRDVVHYKLSVSVTCGASSRFEGGIVRRREDVQFVINPNW